MAPAEWKVTYSTGTTVCMHSRKKEIGPGKQVPGFAWGSSNARNHDWLFVPDVANHLVKDGINFTFAVPVLYLRATNSALKTSYTELSSHAASDV